MMNIKQYIKQHKIGLSFTVLILVLMGVGYFDYYTGFPEKTPEEMVLPFSKLDTLACNIKHLQNSGIYEVPYSINYYENHAQMDDQYQPSFHKLPQHLAMQNIALKGTKINKLPAFKQIVLDYNQGQLKSACLLSPNRYQNYSVDYNLLTNITHINDYNRNVWLMSPIDRYQSIHAQQIAKSKSYKQLYKYFTHKNKTFVVWDAIDNSNDLSNSFTDDDSRVEAPLLKDKDLIKVLNNTGFDDKLNQTVFKGSTNSLNGTHMLDYASYDPVYSYKYLSGYFYGYVPYKGWYLKSFIPDNNDQLEENRGNDLYFGPDDFGKMSQMTVHSIAYIPAISQFGKNNLDQEQIKIIYNSLRKTHVPLTNLQSLYYQIYQPTQYFKYHNQIRYDSSESLSNADLNNRIAFCNNALNLNKLAIAKAHDKRNFDHPEKDKAFLITISHYIKEYKNQCRDYQKSIAKYHGNLVIHSQGQLGYNSNNNTIINSSITMKSFIDKHTLSYNHYAFNNKPSIKLDKIPKNNKNAYPLVNEEQRLVDKQKIYDQIQDLIAKYPDKGKQLMRAVNKVLNSFNKYKHYSDHELVNRTRNYLSHWW